MARLLGKNKLKAAIKNPATKVTFIPEATTTWAVPVVFKASQKALDKLDLAPKTMPAIKSACGLGSVIL